MSMTTPNYRLLDHTADLGIIVTGSTLKTLFENAAGALTQLMLTAADPVKTSSLQISVTADDPADLMVRWLGEILYLFEGDNLVVTSSDVSTMTSSRLKATLQIVPYDPAIHEIQHEIKAVTYHQIKVVQTGDLWEARIIFDV